MRSQPLDALAVSLTSPHADRSWSHSETERTWPMSIVAKNLRKRFGSFQAVNDVSFKVPAGPTGRAPGSVGFGQEYDPEDHRRAGGGRLRRGSIDGRGCNASARPGSGRRLRVSALCTLSPYERTTKCGVWSRSAEASRPGDSRPGRRAARAGSDDGLPGPLPVAALGRSAAAGGPGASSGTAAQSACFSTSPSAHSMPGFAKNSARGFADCTTRST